MDNKKDTIIESLFGIKGLIAVRFLSTDNKELLVTVLYDGDLIELNNDNKEKIQKDLSSELKGYEAEYFFLEKKEYGYIFMECNDKDLMKCIKKEE